MKKEVMLFHLFHKQCFYHNATNEKIKSRFAKSIAYILFNEMREAGILVYFFTLEFINVRSELSVEHIGRRQP